jgi:serine/threonine protein kinase
MPDRVGQHLGNYYLVRLLGQGGFAEVYMGEHRYLGTQAAIKVLHTQIVGEDTDAFQKEARTIARLVHPNIVRVFDFGIEVETPFLVMDYAPNGSVRRLHPKGVALVLPTILGYVKQVADALQYAHDEHFIHRDIKPENLLVGRRQEILLSDFGIALIAQTSRSQSMQDVAGTASYMAPEQFQGKPRPASDQYALAVMVYEWLTGTCPFYGSFTEIASQHLFVPPPPFRVRNSTILPGVEQVVMTALAKDPHQRWASVKDFATAFEQACQGEVSRTLPASWSLHPTDAMPELRQTQSPTELAIAPNESVIPTELMTPSSQASLSATELAVPSNRGSIPRELPLASELSATPFEEMIPQRQSFALERSIDKLHPQQGGISRRMVIMGLGLTGLAVVVGGGIGLMALSQRPQTSLVSTKLPSATASSATSSPPPTSSPLPTSKAGFSDEFKGQIDPRWMWVDPSNDSTHTVTNQGFLRIATAHADKDLFPSSNFNAPRLLQPITGNFIVETRIRFNPTYYYEGAGILVWGNTPDPSFLYIEHSYADFNGLEFDQYINGTYTKIRSAFHAFNPGPQVTATLVDLRLERTGDTFISSWRDSSASQGWQTLGSTSAHFDSLLVGLTLVAQAQSGNPDVPTSADYDYFRVS